MKWFTTTNHRVQTQERTTETRIYNCITFGLLWLLNLISIQGFVLLCFLIYIRHYIPTNKAAAFSSNWHIPLLGVLVLGGTVSRPLCMCLFDCSQFQKYCPCLKRILVSKQPISVSKLDLMYLSIRLVHEHILTTYIFSQHFFAP